MCEEIGENMRDNRLRRMLLTLGLSAVLMLGSVVPAYAVVKSVGGGTWEYGTTYSSGRTVYSYYLHNSLMHSARAVGDFKDHKIYAVKKVWARASVTEPTAKYTSKVYWDTH